MHALATMRIGGLLFVIACVPAPPLPEVAEEGVHVRVAADSGLLLCAGSLSHMDEFVARVSERLGETPPEGEARITLYWLDEVGFYERSGCSAPAIGCEKDGVLFAKAAPLNHEFVHAIAHNIGHPSPFFIEGLAEAYEGLGAIRQAPMLFTYGARETVLASHYLAVEYGAAGAFTAFLIKRHGIEAYLAAYALWPSAPTEQAIDAVFQDVFGVSLFQSMDDFEAAQVPCSRAENDAKLVECAAAEIAWDGSSLVASRTLSCAQDDAVGPFGGDELVVLNTLVIPRGGMYEISVLAVEAAVPSSSISLVPCGPCGSGPSVAVSAGDPVQMAALTAGRYSLRVHGSSKITTRVRYHVKAISAGGTATQAEEVSRGDL